MSYLKLPRGRLLLACCVIASLILVAFPRMDIRISNLFFDGRFSLQDHWLPRLLHAGVGWFLIASLATVTAIYGFNRLRHRNVLGVQDRTVAYLFLVLLLGAGLVVNFAFKDHFGRARPRDVDIFGGTRHFTPAFVPTDQCDRNCSFSSGDAAGAFFALALARALSRRRTVFAAAVGFGALVAASRIVSGAHFFSDNVVSFLVMLLATDVLYHYLLAEGPERSAVPAVQIH